MTPRQRLRAFLAHHSDMKYALRRPRRLLVAYRHRDVRDPDVLLSSFPRSGSTWLRFMLGEYLSERSSDFEHVHEVMPYVGEHFRVPALLPGGGRLIKTHESYRPSGVRTIYLVRDVRAVLLSMYKMRKRAGYRRGFDTFVRDFVAGRAGWFGSWSDHVTFWLGADGPIADDILLIRFEDLRREPQGPLRDIFGFLGIDVDPDRLGAVISNNELRRMQEKERQAAEGTILNRRPDLPFVGAGAVDAWREELTDGTVALVERSSARQLERLGYRTTGVHGSMGSGSL